MTIHESKYGTYHPAPDAEVAWTVNDTRGYIDAGPACDGCGACECEPCPECKSPRCQVGILPDIGKGYCGWHGDPDVGQPECIGLSFAFVCLDGGESYCQSCFDALPDRPAVVECDCA